MSEEADDKMLKANIDIPADVSREAMHLLTRLIGPVADITDVLSDRIRFHRWKTALRVVERASVLAGERNRELSPVELKFLVPFIEEASLEAEDSELNEKWANLLVTAGTYTGVNYKWCVECLSAIDAWQARLLDTLACGKHQEDFFRPDGFTFRHSEQDFVGFVQGLEVCDESKLVEAVEAFGGYNLFFHNDDIPNTNEFSLYGVPEGASLLHLESLGLVTVNSASFINHGKRHFLLNVRLMPLGYEFVAACRGDED
ncbi:hypothetical protein [Parvibaculum sp.]|uniref:Abi-alpha family protein n=1 Tax=Parvibaculum sp. TaxID=2024848 RepID=UPI000C8A6859|nr:hypothetical protein [Parvibaculum sp.]MAB14393.1 hypothetical protein [Parvibaculum sp.]HAW92158.1 hypothetical protein [Candidatus Azambacteria bacterium]